MSMTLMLAVAANLAVTSVKILPGECWWGGVNTYRAPIPYDEKTETVVDITRPEIVQNQYDSLFVSTKGRVIRLPRQASFTFHEGTIEVRAPEDVPVTVERPGATLREAYLHASRTYMPPDGATPDPLYFSAPHYCTWIELTYNQNEKDILAYAKSMLDHGFPPGILMIDDTWQLGYGLWEFDPRRFRDPKGMIAELHRLGFKVLLWVCPFVSMDTPPYRLLTTGIDPMKEERFPTGGFMMTPDGSAVQPVSWWNGYSALLDFTHPNAHRWFRGELARLMNDYGADGFKFDGGNIMYYCRGYRAHEDLPSGEQADRFGWLALDYPSSSFCYSWHGGGKAIMHRLGDKDHTWKALRDIVPELIGGGLLGCPFIIPDMVGGGEYKQFLPGSPFDRELFVRSAQLHAFCATMQFSASPWRVLDERGQRIVKDVIRLRQERFAKYFVRVAAASGKSGEPIVRALEYQFPGHGYERIVDQFLVGDRLLVAPQLVKGAESRKVIVPPGKWIADDGTEVEGPCTIEVATHLERIPHFVAAAGLD